MTNKETIVCRGSYFTVVWFGFILLVCFSGLFTFLRALLSDPASIELGVGTLIAIGCILVTAYKTYQGFVIINAELTISADTITLRQFKNEVVITFNEISTIRGVKRKMSVSILDTKGQEMLIDSGLNGFDKATKYILLKASGIQVIANKGYFFNAPDIRKFLSEHRIQVQD